MIISNIKIESALLPFHKVEKLETNNLSAPRDSTFLLMLRDPNILSAPELFIASSDCTYAGTLPIEVENSSPLLYPSDTSSVLGESADNICFYKRDERYLYMHKSTKRRDPIVGGAFIYINGLIKEVFQNKVGTISSSHNCTIFEGRKFARKLDSYDYWKVDNLSIHCVHDCIFTAFVFRRDEPDTQPTVNLVVEWDGLNASYCLTNWLTGSSECVRVEKYSESGYENLFAVCKDFYEIWNSTWNAVYLNLKDGCFYQNDRIYQDAYSSFTDGEEERWFRSIELSVYDAAIYFSDVLIANLPSSSNHLFTNIRSDYNQRKKVYDLLYRGNFYWEP